jgi:two-component system NtrC family sensor kinase
MKPQLEKKPRLVSPLVDKEHHGHAYFDQLRRKLRWQLLIVYVTPLLLLSAYFHFEYNATMREGVYNHLKSVAEHQRNTVDLFLRERVANLKGAFRPEWLTSPPAPETLQKDLWVLQEESDSFVDIGLFRPDGTLVAYAGPHTYLVGKDYSQEAWFQQLSKQERDYFISDVYLGFRGKPHFIVAVRRIEEDQHWALRVSVDPEKFGKFVRSSYLFKDAEAFVVNGQGQRQTFSGEVIPAPEPSKVPTKSPETEVTDVEVGGQEYLRALAWLTEADWALVVRVPAAKAYEPISHARFVLVGFLVLTLIVILFVVLRSTRRLVGKLESADTVKEELRLQLFNAAKLASVGEMAAGVAHEINNPLAIVYEEASMMKDIMDPQFGQKVDLDEFRERLGAITDAALRGRSITSKLMAFARKHDPDPEPTDIVLLLDRVIEVKALDFKTSNIEVVQDYEKDLPWVMVNRNQMDQVLLNLLNNAKDAIDRTGRITARVRREDDWVRIDIQDTGRGMTMEIMEKIFMPFYTTKGVGKGTGLGLSISYGIVDSLGGRIEVKSAPGSGSTFSIFLPVLEEAQAARGARNG